MVMSQIQGNMTISKESSDKPECTIPDGKCKCGNPVHAHWKVYFTPKGEFVNGAWVKTYGEWEKWFHEVCDDCRKIEHEKEIAQSRQWEKERNEQEERERFRMCGLKQIHKTMTFDTFIINDSNKQVFEFMQKYSDKPNSGIFLTGKCGSGKTHLAAAVAIKLFNLKKNVKFVTVPRFLLDIRDTFKKDSKISELDLVDYHTNSKFLILDDFGAEKVSEWTLEVIFVILDTLINDMKPFIITSNLTIKEISEKFNDRIASRIVGNCKIIELTDKDHRLQKENI